MGHLAETLYSRGLLVYTDTHVGITTTQRKGRPEALQDCLPISILASLERCGYHDKCWPLLFCSGDIYASHKLCCNKSAHQDPEGCPEHRFNVTTYQYVRDFRISRGMELARMDKNGNGTWRADSSLEHDQQRPSKGPKVGDYYQSKGQSHAQPGDARAIINKRSSKGGKGKGPRPSKGKGGKYGGSSKGNGKGKAATGGGRGTNGQ